MKVPPAHPKSAARTLGEALTAIRARCAPLPPERVPLAEALGRVLREPVGAPNDLPPFDRSGGDGFAIRTGSDDTLDQEHVQRMAGRFSRRVYAWAKAHGVR